MMMMMIDIVAQSEYRFDAILAIESGILVESESTCNLNRLLFKRVIVERKLDSGATPLEFDCQQVISQNSDVCHCERSVRPKRIRTPFSLSRLYVNSVPELVFANN